MFNRKTIRLQSYDYSLPGYYFNTICLQDKRIHRLGTVKNDIMNVTEAGALAAFHWSDIPNHYPNITLDAWIIMPNHMHGIIIIHDTHPESNKNVVQTINEIPNTTPVGTIQEFPNNNSVGAIQEFPQGFVQNYNMEQQSTPVGAIQELPKGFVQNPKNTKKFPTNNMHKSPQQSPQQRRKMTLAKAIGRFKMKSSRSINAIQDSSGQKFWQRNYYEHIIRDEQDYNRIREYILNNPRKWNQDKFH